MNQRTSPAGWVAVVALALLLGCGPAAAGPATLETETGKLKELRATIESLTRKLDAVRGERDTRQAALEKTDRAIGRIRNELRSLDREAAAADTKLASLEQQRDAVQARLASMRGELRRELRAAWIAGRQQRIKLLLNQQDPAGVARMLTYQDYFTRAHTHRMDTFRATLQSLQETAREVSAQQERIADLRARHEQQVAQLAEEQQTQRKLVSGLQQQLQSGNDRLSQLRQDEQRVNQLVASLQQAVQRMQAGRGSGKSLRQLKGQLRWPVSGPVTMPYGARLASGQTTSHGVHIQVPAGTEVHAVARGRVVFADWLRGFGLLIIIDHGSGYMTLYGENSSLYKAVGDRVEQGEVISAAGSSGGAARTGIYMELRRNGQPLNPQAWFKGQPAQQQAGR
jgi:septal ring factor EnvC (AmiA/AmiB activator)